MRRLQPRRPGRSGTLGAVEAPAPQRHWWAIGPDPDLPPITAKRAYAEVLLVYLSIFSVGIIAAALLLGGRGKDLPTNGSWGVYMTSAASILSEIAMAVALVYLLSARRGVSTASLGLRLPRLPDGRVAVSTTIRIAAWCFFAIILGAFVNALLQSGHLPTSHLNVPEQIFGVVDGIQAGIVEELVVLAFLVVSLRQAGRPWWEVTTVALVLRGAYHIYYGPGVFGILVWAALYYWIYLRFRTVVPLIVCHSLFDVVGFLSQATVAVVLIGALVVAGLFITAPILWLVERSSGGAGEGGGAGGAVWPSYPVAAYPPGPVPAYQAWPTGRADLPPAGWHPDPAGFNRWRWWDGSQWTEHVSQHSM